VNALLGAGEQSRTATARLLAGVRPDGRPQTLAEHRALHGLLPAVHRHDDRTLQAALSGAGLRGRGGAGFPAARKLAAAHAAGKRGLLLANGSEGEPASRKDSTLLRHAPHLVLDGAQLAARSIRAREIVVSIHQGSGLAAVLTTALRERAGTDELPVRLLEIPNRYVAGEASSVARAAGGGASLPVLHDQPLAVRGLDGKPQVVLNVETLAGLALYLMHGATWYGGLGTADEPGTALVTVRSSGTQPAVVEVPLGTPVRAALTAAGVATEGLEAVLVGGYFGAWLPAPTVLDVPLSHTGMRAAGGTLGAGIIIALGQHECGLRATAEIVRYLSDQSARQCGPCLNGLPAIATAVEALASGRPPAGTLENLARWCGLVERRGLCNHPDGTVSLVRSALAVFAEDLQAHLDGVCFRAAGTAAAVPVRGAA
jgi:NADH:ubiquinone oxidoreductase subunit F (NADH-binding)